MSRSTIFTQWRRAVRIACYCEDRNISTREGLQRVAAAEMDRAACRASRREFLASAGKFALVGALGDFLTSGTDASAARAPAPQASIAIVGAGLAGLVCADELRTNGIHASVFDATERVGGRCYSLRNFFSGQTAERGGEFIDNLHKTLIRYAQQFKLKLEDVDKQQGEVFYFFNGQHHAEAEIVDEFRAFVGAIQQDLRKLSSAPTADDHTEADAAIDRVSLEEYLETRGAGGLIKAVIAQAYKAEYGFEIDEQSCLNFLFFIHADKRSKFRPFGIFSDERYHVIDGNDRIAQGLANRLQSPVQFNMLLVRIRKTAAGKVELTFRQGSTTKTSAYDAAVLAIPFTILREVELDANLDLPPWKLQAIDTLGYGTNAKMMVGFNGRPWLTLGSIGESYSDLAHHQLTWETNPINATTSRGVLTDYSSGDRGADLNSKNAQREASLFLSDLDRVFPGAAAAASRDQRGNLRVHLEHWPSNPLTKGSYTCYKPGQFTTIAGLEGKQVGNLYFAGEHTNSFYEWQGFMEGAALSGIETAQQILADLKAGVFG